MNDIYCKLYCPFGTAFPHCPLTSVTSESAAGQTRVFRSVAYVINVVNRKQRFVLKIPCFSWK